jgi:hypothetical protein
MKNGFLGVNVEDIRVVWKIDGVEAMDGGFLRDKAEKVPTAYHPIREISKINFLKRWKTAILPILAYSRYRAKIEGRLVSWHKKKKKKKKKKKTIQKRPFCKIRSACTT